MNAITAFVLGLLAGWIIEWLIDWFYWRRKNTQMANELEQLRSLQTDWQKTIVASDRQRVQLADLKAENEALKNKLTLLEAEKPADDAQIYGLKAENVALKGKLAALEGDKTAQMSQRAERSVAEPVIPDDLEIINGIGPVIAKKLNAAGICTFEELGKLTAEDLRRIVGDIIQRLADEDDILNQARQLAQERRQKSSAI